MSGFARRWEIGRCASIEGSNASRHEARGIRLLCCYPTYRRRRRRALGVQR